MFQEHSRSSKRKERPVGPMDGNNKGKPYEYGVSSLIGASSGISLDGESVRLPGDDGFVPDDISSIHDVSSYHQGANFARPKIKIMGTVGSTEEGNNDHVTPASIALSDQMRRIDQRAAKEKKKSRSSSHSVPQGEAVSTRSPPDTAKTSKLSGSNGARKSESNWCTPQWVQVAPRWLKVVISFSLALLVGAVVLVTVALSTDLASKDKSNVSSRLTGPGSSSLLSPSPTQAPHKIYNVWSGTPQPTRFVVTKHPVPTSGTSPAPQTANRSQSTSLRIPANNSASTPSQPDNSSTSSGYLPEVTTFFVIGGRFTYDDNLPDELRSLPARGGTSFLVHLGDWNSPYATGCDEQSYKDVNALYSNSSIPVYFIPGGNEYNDCPKPKQAMSLWHKYLQNYETQYWPEPSHWNVTTDTGGYPENFAFVYNEILFIGINLVDGLVQDNKEWSTRQAADLQWIDDNFQQHRDNIKAFVLFAHAGPDVPTNSGFYEPFKQKVSEEYNQVPVVLIHRNLEGEPWSWETTYENIHNLSVIVVRGSSWPPLMAAIDFRQKNPFIFDQSTWYDQFMNQRTRGLRGN